jgi:hypothetical protein
MCADQAGVRGHADSDEKQPVGWVSGFIAQPNICAPVRWVTASPNPTYAGYNPIKHGYVTRVADWQFSSFHRFVQLGI